MHPFFSTVDRGPASSSSKKLRSDVRLLIVAWLACTLGLFCLRAGYLFPPFDIIDSWVYTGYQWDLRAQIREFGPTYYGSRLSIILPGVAAHAWLPPVAANLVVKLIGSALLTLAFASLTYFVAGLRAALMAVTCSVLSPQIIYTLHTDYMDGPVIIYASLALAGITFARYSRHWYVWIAFAGAAFICMAVANLSSPVIIGLGIATYHLLWLRWGVGKHALALLVYGTSAALVLTVMGAIHTRYGGSFYFLRPQIEVLFLLKKMGTTPWTPPNWLWLQQATWVLLPAAALLWGALRSFRRDESGDSPLRQMIRGMTFSLAVTLSVALYMESTGSGVLAYDFYASLQLCFALPLLALCCATGKDTQTARAVWPYMVMGALLILVTQYDTHQIAARLLQVLPAFMAGQVVLALLFGLAAVTLVTWLIDRTCGIRWRQVLPRSADFVILLFLFSMRPGFHAATSDHARARYVAVHASFEALSRDFPPDSYRLWSHPGHLSSLALTSSKLWGYRLWTSLPFPSLDLDHTPERTVVVTGPEGSGPKTLRDAAIIMARHKMELTQGRVISIPGEAGTGFDLACFTPIESNRPLEQAGSEASWGRMLFEIQHEPGGLYMPAFETNVYGKTKAAILQEVPEGWISYIRTDPRDCLATPYVPLDAKTSAQARELLLAVDMPTDGRVLVVLQREGYVDLQGFSLTQKGRSLHRVSLPAGVKAFRMYIRNTGDKPTALPDRVAVHLLP